MHFLPAEAITWPRAPAQLRLDEAEVHVWAADLDPGPPTFANLAAVLSDEEKTRAQQFRFQHLQRRYTAGRGWLRAMLGRYLRIDPDRLEFMYSPNGKPALANRFADAAIHFNLAHSDNLALFAFTRIGAVGVDVERIRSMKDAPELVARFFSARESGLFQKVTVDQQPAAFFNLWTRKEALLKATGVGITGGLNELEVTFLPGEPARLLAVAGDANKAAQWSLQDLSPASGFAGAVAVQAQNLRVQCWKWE